MASSRRQPSTIDTQRVTKRDQRTESRNQTQSSKKPHTKFNSGFNVEAVFGAISQLLETFTSQVLDNTGVNMSLLLRTIYRNLDDDLVGILSEPQNVEALNKYLSEKNQEILSTTEQESISSEDQSVVVETPQVTSTPVEVEGVVTETKEQKSIVEEQPDVVEDTKVTVTDNQIETEPNLTVDEEKVSTQHKKSEVKPVDLSNFTNTQKLCALGEADEDNIDILEIAKDFVNELIQDAWKLNSVINGIRVQQEERYEDFQDNVVDNDEDEYEYNLYRDMYNKERKLSEENKENIENIIKQRAAKEKGGISKKVGQLSGIAGKRLRATTNQLAPKIFSDKKLFTNIATDLQKVSGKRTSSNTGIVVNSPTTKIKSSYTNHTVTSGKKQSILVRSIQDQERKAFQKSGLVKQISSGRKRPTSSQKKIVIPGSSKSITKSSIISSNPILSKASSSESSKKSQIQVNKSDKIGEDKDKVVSVKKSTIIQRIKKALFGSKKKLKVIRQQVSTQKPTTYNTFIYNNIFVYAGNVLKGTTQQQTKAARSDDKQLNFTVKAFLGMFLKKKEPEAPKEEDKKQKEDTEEEAPKGRLTKQQKLDGWGYGKPERDPREKETTGIKPAELTKPKKKSFIGMAFKKINGLFSRKKKIQPESKLIKNKAKTKKRKSTRASKSRRSRKTVNVINNVIVSKKRQGNLTKTIKMSSVKTPKLDTSIKKDKSKKQPIEEKKKESTIIPEAVTNNVVGKKTSSPTSVTNKPSARIKPLAVSKIEKPSSVNTSQKVDVVRGSKVAEKKAETKKDLVSIPRSQLSQAKGLSKQQAGLNKAASKAPSSRTPSISGPKPVASKRSTSTKLSNPTPLQRNQEMDPAEAFQRNIESGKVWLDNNLFGGKLSDGNISLPNNAIGRALAKIVGSTSKVAKKTEDDITRVEDQVNKPDKGDGLLKRILRGILKFTLVFLGGIALITFARKAIGGWLPRGGDGKMLHGPTIFGIKLPNFKDMIRMGRGMFYLAKNIVQKAILFTKKLFKKETWIKLWNGVKWLGRFTGGYIAGRVALATLKRITWVFSFFTGIPPAEIAKNAQTLIAGITAIAMLVKDVFKFGGKVKDKFKQWKANRKAKRDAQRKTFEVGATEKSMANITSAAKNVKTLVPMEEVMPKEMTAKGVTKGGLPKAILPDMGHVTQYNKAAQNEQKLSRSDDKVVSAKKNLMASAGKQADVLDKRVAKFVPIDTDPTKPNTVFSIKKSKLTAITKLARIEIDKLKKAKKRVKDNFVPQHFWTRQADVSDWIDTKTGEWNQKYVYFSPENKGASLSVMSTTPFEPISSSPTFKIAVPYKQQDYGIMPLSFKIPGTGQLATADIYEWERNRIETGISIWKCLVIAAHTYGYGTKAYNNEVAHQAKRWAEISMFPNYRSRMSTKQMIDAWNNYQKNREKNKKKEEKLGDKLKAAQEPLIEKKNGTPKGPSTVGWTDGGIVNMNGTQIHMFKAPDGSIIRVNHYQLQAAGGDALKAAMKQYAAKNKNKDTGEEKQSDDKASTQEASKSVVSKPSSLLGRIKNRLARGLKKGVRVAKAAGKAYLKAAKAVGRAYLKTAKVATTVFFPQILIAKWAIKKAVKKFREVTFANKFIDKALKQSPWRELASGKAERIKKALGIDNWFPKKPAMVKSSKREKPYQEGAGKIAYNILTELGFVYNRDVWNNPEFLKVRPMVFDKLGNSVTDYVNNVLQVFRNHLLKLRKEGDIHRTRPYQEAILKSAQETIAEFNKKNDPKEFMKFVAQFYKPTDYHLIIRDKDGKIIKEAGKELIGFKIPENIYESDPALWDKVIEGMDRPQPGEKAGWFKLRVARKKVEGGVKWIQKRSKLMDGQKKSIQKRKKAANRMFVISFALVTSSMRKIKKQIRKAKRQIRWYFRKQMLIYKGPMMLVKGLAKGVAGAAKFVGGKIKGLFGKIRHSKVGNIATKKIKDLKAKAKQNIDMFAAKVARREQALKDQILHNKNELTAKYEGVITKIKRKADKRKSFFRQKIDRAKKANLKLYGMFYKKHADDTQIEVQTQEIAKEMIPNGDQEGKARIRNIVKMANDRKKASESERASIGGYWADLKRKWEDRISEQSMKELKNASLKLSNNILDYLGMVRELPTGQVTFVNQTINQQPVTVELLPDIEF